MPRRGIDVAQWLVSKSGGFLDKRLSRRSFIARTTMVGTAVAASGCAVVAGPGAPYTYVTDCGGGSLCRDGYTELCCVINQGQNQCPPGTAAAGWWRASGSAYCPGGTRYFVDCNNWQGAGPCRCAAGCGTRKVYCNHFRYGQCNTHIGGTGVIACRLVTCVPPYDINELNCNPSGAVDNATANHNANCAAYAPPPPPPPPPVPVPLTLPVVGALTDGAGGITLVARGTDGAAWLVRANSTGGFSSWESLGGTPRSAVAIAEYGADQTIVGAKDDQGQFAWTIPDGSGGWTPWAQLAGLIKSDPVLVSTGSQVVAFVRGNSGQVYASTWDGSSWSSWVTTAGVTISDLAAVLDGTSIIVAARGTDRAFYANRFSNGTFGSWRGYGGVLTSDPVVTRPASGPGALVIVRGSTHQLHLHGFGGASPPSWQALPSGSFTSEGALALVGSERHAFGCGNGGAVFWSRNVSGAWSAWQSLGFDARSRPVAVYDGSELFVFALGSDSQLWYQRWTGAWDPGWTQVPVPGTTLAPAKGYA